MTQTEPLVELRNVSVVLNGNAILCDLCWQLGRGEHWAISGSNGSGKSTFLKLIRGEIWPSPGKGERISRIAGLEKETALALKQRVAIVSPELQDRYLQQEWRLSALQVVYSGFLNGDYVYKRPSAKQKEFAATVINVLGIGPLLRRNVQQLSTGELRKVLIARALAGKPFILALDEVCDGLDASARRDLLGRLEQIARSGTQIVFATHRREELFAAITHELVLEKGRMVSSGRRRECDAASGVRESPPLPFPPVRTGESGKGLAHPKSRTLLRIEGADLFLERKKVLTNIDWEIRSGQHWVVLGRNGAGKSTLLKLAFGDLYAAWGGKVSRFRFTAKNTISQVRRKIGYVGPELQAHYRRPLNGAEVVGSGFHGSIGLRDPLRLSERQAVAALLKRFGVTELGTKSATQMSYGELRKLLLLRAVVNQPELLICDEPFDGLDTAAKAEFSQALQHVAEAGASIVVVTHHVGDIPPFITHGLLLNHGRIVIQGRLETLRTHRASRPDSVTGLLENYD